MFEKGNLNLETRTRILVPALFSIALFFSWIMLVNGLRISFYMYYERTIFLIYVDRFIDPIIWLLSAEAALVVCAIVNRGRSVWFLPSILLLASGAVIGTLTLLGVVASQMLTAGSLLTLAGCVLGGFAITRTRSSLGRRNFAIVSLLTLSLLVLPAELGSLLYYVASAFQPGTTLGKSWELLEMQLWYTAFPLIPFLYAAFLFSWIWAPLALRIIPGLRRVDEEKGAKGSARSTEDKTWLWLIALIVISVFLGWYPYFHDVGYPLVGTDIYLRYVLPAQRVLASGAVAQQWVTTAARELHPLVVLAIAAASTLAGSMPELLLRYAYVLLILGFSGSIFILVKSASGSKILASISALVATISPSTTIGMYTGIVANWWALIVWAISLVPLALVRLHGLRGRVLLILGLGFGSVVVLFLHPWTWIAFVAGLVAYSLILLICRRRFSVRDLALIGLLVLINGIAVIASLPYLTTVQIGNQASALTMIQLSIASGYLGLRSWEILDYFSQVWSPFLHPLFLALSVLGTLALVRRSSRVGLIVLAWIVAASLTTIAAAPMGYSPLLPGRGDTALWRATFLTPFQIPVAAGILSLEQNLNNRLGRSRSAIVITTIFLSVLFLAILNGALRALFPLLTDPHNYPIAT